MERRDRKEQRDMTRARRKVDKLKEIATTTFFKHRGQGFANLMEADPDWDHKRSRRFRIEYEPRGKKGGDFRSTLHQVILRVTTPPDKKAKAYCKSFAFDMHNQSDEIFQTLLLQKFNDAMEQAENIKTAL